ncbi:tRNA (cytidine/uridine-2'-O-)-methyltransferase TrmJ [Planktothrix serta PCC 8927]|uniref:tRNA (cytidine/uridine-2'-O-)-methyltransferase TrmJ n=1 Tax=Planktothrix serta PCC 8927 TaxID=671068 RepID=A0A7Z9E4Z2_9CYAN|nr:RNA methyltransferase [Planktothrix serta]VXD25049.1 tRNA (cytidine/uridine-2'-O-)-methyltransferase TrmJ [Planktothrix serta PCC 8927]
MTQTDSYTRLTPIRIVLVEPAGPLNVGSVARVMKNMGLEQLVLVNPQCNPACDEAKRMAVHAGDILERAITVSSLPEALTGCQRAIATTARSRSDALPTDLEDPRTVLPWLLDCPSALIFGPEDRGLNNDELSYAQRFLRIRSSLAYPSLNLAQSVGVCCYELRYCVLETQKGTEDSIEIPPSTVSLEVLEGYYQQLEAMLLKIGYVYPHTANSRMKKFRRLFNRANLTSEEVMMLRGILSQVEWALNCNNYAAIDDTLKTSPDH